MDMFALRKPDNETKCDPRYSGSAAVEPGNRVQVVLSLVLGLTAFIAFCFLRPRWKTLYAARKRHLDPAIGLPPLPDSFFGWIPALYRITEEQVLACGGLDAFVFLSFFKMSMRLFFAMLLFAAAGLAPIHHHFGQAPDWESNRTEPDTSYAFSAYHTTGPTAIPAHHQQQLAVPLLLGNGSKPGTGDGEEEYTGYLWAYLVFTYFFTFLTVWFVNSETFKIIRIRQDYLGTQSTVTDRTFRLTGIPTELRSDDKIRDLVESLEIGKVEHVTLCRDWAELDGLVARRATLLHKLERAWGNYLALPAEQHSLADHLHLGGGGGSRSSRSSSHLRRQHQQRQEQDTNDEDAARGDGLPEGDEEGVVAENGRLLSGGEVGAHQYVERERPTTRIWYGFLGLQSRRTDAIDYFEEKLRRLDERIVVARRKKYEPVDIAFVTMDSIAACQMAIQALLDPRPGQLLTKLAPAPSDVVWHNTYARRSTRRLRSWLITAFIGALTIVWLAPVAWLASLTSLCTIEQWWPGLSDWLLQHGTVRALVQTGLPTITVSLLNVAIPYFYDYLSNHQGQLSRGEVELSIISKNFFFNFFNIFLVFTVVGTASNFWTFLNDNIRDLTLIASHLAQEIVRLHLFYINFIMLQGLGLFPVRLLEFGSVFLYPFNKLLARTPRDRSLVDQPPVFSYGFYLPTALLIFILCLVYSVLPGGYLVLLLGLVYFTLGYYTYKYQLLYAMDAPRHATGGAWRIIAHRVCLGLLVAQVCMSGILALKKAFVSALLVVPLLIMTVWYMYYFRRRFEPLTKYISLRSIRRDDGVDDDLRRAGRVADEEAVVDEDEDEDEQRRGGGGGGGSGGVVGRVQAVVTGRTRNFAWRRMSTVDEDRERGLRFVNPSLTTPLEQPWIYDDPPPVIPESQQPSEPGSSDDLDDRYDDGMGATNSRRPTFDSARVARSDERGLPVGGSTSSSLSLGDTHIWRDS